MFDGISVSKYSLEQLIKAANLIVNEGDCYGSAAKHPTTILTRQIIERLAKELEERIENGRNN